MPTVAAFRSVPEMFFSEPARVRSTSRHRRLVTLAGLVVGLPAAFALAYLRLTPGDRQSVWAEDGKDFLNQQLGLGFSRALVEPHNGYLHLVPRLAAAVVAAFPLPMAATLFALAGSAMVVLSAVAIFTLSRDHLPSVAVRLGLAAFVVLLPVGGLEADGNVANSHWYLMAAAFWGCLARPRDAVRITLAALVVALAMASDPLTLILLPLVVLRVALLRRWRDHVVTLAFAAATAFQLYGVLGTARQAAHHTTAPALLASYAARVPLGFIGGAHGSEVLFADYRWGAVAVAVAGCLLSVVVAAFGSLRLLLLALAGTVGSLAYFVVPVSISWYPQFDPRGPGGIDVGYSSRYSIVPLLLISVAVAAALQALRRRAPRALFRAAGVVLVAGLALSVVPGYRPQQDIRNGANWRAGVQAARVSCQDHPGKRVAMIKLAPTGGPWTIPVACTRLR